MLLYDNTQYFFDEEQLLSVHYANRFFLAPNRITVVVNDQYLPGTIVAIRSGLVDNAECLVVREAYSDKTLEVAYPGKPTSYRIFSTQVVLATERVSAINIAIAKIKETRYARK